TFRTIRISDVRAKRVTWRKVLTVMSRIAEKCNTEPLVRHSDFRPKCYDLNQGSQPHLMVRRIRIALLAIFVSIAAAPYTYAQQDLTFTLFERYLDALR